MKKKMQRILAGLLAVLLVASTVDITAFASSKVEESAAGGQEGTFDAGDQAVSKGEAKAPLVVSEGDLQPEFLKAGEGEVSRIEWLQEIIATFDMRVDSDNYPDNYYSDVDDSDSYYVDIMVATEFGLIDTEAGEAFCPEDAATREFAAHSLNLAYGYTTYTEGYTFNESEQVTYPDDIQVSIDLGWFALSGGDFLPKQAVTTTEKNVIFKQVQDVLEETTIFPEESHYQFKSNVLVLDPDTEIINDGEGILRLVGYKGTPILIGDLFGIDYQGMPLAWYAKSITNDGDDLIIEIETASLEEAFEEVQTGGIISADLSNVVTVSDSVTLSYIVGGTEENNYEDGEILRSLEEVGDREINGIVASGEETTQSAASLELGAAKVKYEVTITDIKPYHEFSNNTVRIGATYKINSAVSVKGDIGKVVNFTDDLIKIPIAPGCYFSPTMDFELSGEISTNLVEKVTLGIQYANKGFRVEKSFQKESFTIVAVATVKIGIKLTASFEVPGFSAYLAASTGLAGEGRCVKHTDGLKPDICLNCAYWMYAQVEAKAEFKVGIGKWAYRYELAKLQLILYDQNNSPIRVSCHVEDGVQVPACSDPERYKNGTEEKVYPGYNTKLSAGYYSPLNSQYYYNGKSSAVSDGTNTYTIFTYSLDSYNQATITGYKGNAKYVYIPEKLDGYDVVAIGSRAFSGNTSIIGVVIPDSVTTISDRAFIACTKLSAVTLSKNLQTLGYGAFQECTSLEEIEIPKSLNKCETMGNAYGNIANAVFMNSGLKKVTFEEGTTRVATRLFAYCGSLEEITIPDTVTEIADYAFRNAKALKSITIPDNVTYIGTGAFSDCISLKSVQLGKSIGTIYGSAFARCTSITEIVIPDSVTTIEECAFIGCTELSTVILSKNLQKMGYGAFQGCSSLTEIMIPKSLTTCSRMCDVYGRDSHGVFMNSGLKEVTFEEGTTKIATYLFANCGSLEQIMIPETVTSIGEYAFYRASGVKEIIIPNAVTSIGYRSFESCTSLKSVQIGSAVKTIDERAFLGCTYLSGIDIPNSVTVIKANAFNGCTNLNVVTLSKNLQTLEYGAFRGCTSLKEITIPKSLANASKWNDTNAVFMDTGLKEVSFEEGTTQIVPNLFALCGSLEEIVIPNTVTKIGDYAFWNANGLKKVVMSDSVEMIGERAFWNCVSLGDITLPNKLATLKSYAFYNCSSIKEINMPNTVTSWGDHTFQNCTSLESVHIPVNSMNIAAYSFYNCQSLKTINWPDTLQAVRSYAFYNCDALKDVTLPEKVNTIEQYAFYDCDALETFTMPDTVTSLGNYAFDGCDALKTVKLSAGLTAIPTYAFYECGSLESIVLPYRIASIGNYAFANCPKLTSVTIPRATTTFGTNLFSYPANMTIYGVAGTDAETYASNNSIHFEAIDKPATAAVFNLEELTIVKGGTGNLILTVTPSDFTDVVSWKSSDTAVATVTSAGVVTGVASGTAKIRAIIGDSGDVVASCDVTVVQPVTSIRLNKSSVTLEGGATAQLTATVNPSDAYDSTVVWTTSDETVATVTEEGLVTALKKGTATITVTANDGSGKYATCNVTVSSTAHIVDTWTELESAHNYENNTNEKWFYTLSGATALQVTFSEETFVEEDADYIYIYSGTGTLVGKYTGGALAGQTISVEGDTIQIQLVSDDVVNKYGFKVDNVTSASKPIPLQSITLSETTLRVEKGSDSQKLTILYNPENTTESKTAVWTSADESIATVAAGVVFGVSVGTTTITAEVAGKKASCKVTVWENSTTDESTTEVVVVKQKADLNAHFTGTYKKFTVDNKKLAAVSAKGILTAKQPGTVQVTGYEKNGKVWEAKETISVLIEKPLITEKIIIRTRPELTIDGSANITGAEKKPTTWISSKPAVATIDPETGLITTVGKGSTKITAVYGEGKLAAKYTFTVKVAYPAMSKKTAKLMTGATLALKLKNTKLVPEWTSSDPSVASVEAGKVTVHTIGTATITATVEGMGYTCVITVTEPTLSKKEVTLKAVGKTAKLSWKNTKLKGDSITWCSEDPTVATVDANGKITAVAAGTTNITSTAGGTTGVCVVTVKGNSSSR